MCGEVLALDLRQSLVCVSQRYVLYYVDIHLTMSFFEIIIKRGLVQELLTSPSVRHLTPGQIPAVWVFVCGGRCGQASCDHSRRPVLPARSKPRGHRSCLASAARLFIQAATQGPS